MGKRGSTTIGAGHILGFQRQQGGMGPEKPKKHEPVPQGLGPDRTAPGFSCE
ncbi:hypothetical protein ANDA3_2631 [plant metagenome]|uniref:Uncharacterized protein n=1 Tax=plant metagenome TaxID=1297885 RepID=A0A484NX27_9ZZZZ